MRINKSGFTIVELLIVIVIIAILAAITVVAYNGIQERARDSARKSDLAQLAKLYSTYSVDHGPMWSGSGCGASGNGSGWLGVQNSSYPTSVMNCLINSGVTSATIVDPTGATSCSSGSTDCNAYMKYTCNQSGQVVTYFYANLDAGTHNGDETDDTCASGIDTSYGMNYYVKVVPSS